MGLGKGKGEGRSPGASEDEPAVDSRLLAKPLDIFNEVPGSVCLERRVRRGSTATALVEQQDIVALGVEQPPMCRPASGARPAVKEDGWNPVRIAALLPVETVSVADVQRAGPKGLDRRIKRSKAQKLISS